MSGYPILQNRTFDCGQVRHVDHGGRIRAHHAAADHFAAHAV